MRARPLGRLVIVLVAALAGVISAAQTLSVSESQHNLSPTGPGPVRGSDAGVCTYCHAPHNVAPDTPLWNQQLSAANYQMYTSSTYQQVNQALLPGSTSKLCMSCHDGTVALGQTYANGVVPMSGQMDPKDVLGTDLRSDHPFAFNTPLVDDGQLVFSLVKNNPPTTADPSVKLYNSKMECTSCHEPHTPNLDPVVQKFLVRNNANSAMCLACHDTTRTDKPNYLNGWTTSSHNTSSNGTSGNPAMGGYANVATNGCMNCHTSHNAAGGERLLRGMEQNACASCHAGQNLTTALPDVISVFTTNAYAHPTLTKDGIHSPVEQVPVVNRHAECADCHNPHADQGTGASLAPAVPPSLLGVSGLDAFSGVNKLNVSANEYEICFKCHADSPSKPQVNAPNDDAGYGRVPRWQVLGADPYNTRQEFQSSVSRHNVTQPRKDITVPSLRPAMINQDASVGTSMDRNTYLYCSDCHNSNKARNVKGSLNGANGPHGSTYQHILEREYVLEPIPAGGPGTGTPNSVVVPYSSGLNGPYALCDKCHDVDGSILQDVTFPHKEHVVEQGASCATCHAPHGIPGGTTVNNKSLVNFDLRIVGPSQSTTAPVPNPQFDSVNRTCTLTCHGYDHQGEKY